MDVIRVGKFELLPSERVLSLDGRPLELGARAFDLLMALVEHQGRLASKATLIERVWPRVIVDENNLPAQIASLRRVLGAGAIRTVAGFGYRLELPVVSRAPPESPPAAALSLQQRAWPSRLGPLIGRAQELHAIQEALTRCSLLTVVGPAGIGKTRIAQEILAARNVENGGKPTAWVALQALTEPQHVASAIALELGLSLPDGVESFTALREALERDEVLLILDGAERIRDSVATPLAALLQHTQGIRALLTSQVPLGIAGEIVYRLAALPVPQASASHEECARCGSIELFVQRARAADQRFELAPANQTLVTEICRRLDGNPLAIELAAVRVPALGLSALLERLDDRFRLLRQAGRAADPRHAALLAAFDWSYSLLNAEEQFVFDRLGAFVGSFSLQTAARCIVDDRIDTTEAIDLIGRLVDRSLVTVLPDEPPRYALLETARHYALNRLAAREALPAARERVTAALLHLLDTAYEEYWWVDEMIWLHRYAPEIDNVRAAIDWAASHDAERAVALYGSAWPLFVETDLCAEGRRRFEQTVVLLSDELPRERVARFWEAVATYDSARQFDRARYAAELAASMHADSGNLQAQYYDLMLLALNWRGNDEAARAAADAARQLEDPAWPARLLAHGALTEGALMMSGSDWAQARTAYQRAVKFALTTSERQALAATVNVVELDIARGDLNAALQLGRPLALSLRHSGRRETRFELLVLTFSALLLSGEIAEARDTGGELYALARSDPSKLYMALEAMAYLACIDHRFEAAAQVLACADRTRNAHGQARRRPVEEHIRTLVKQRLAHDGGSARAGSEPAQRAELSETAACALALGLS
jgi:predicted ATPase/DNA-binding winged helix-turn-helix (wHTH) protein